ncbi:sodium:proton antiporter [Staphylococcus succinus]|uniref:cation:proton antiporter n=1 Tax=Staphylococcus TaxID=1279 RepID=UPI00062B4A4D|nr:MULTISPECIES: sodium:proton antiporter [Staphylococcus]MDH9160200.1 sodium:proton antiporter [Staphylococcus succinus]MEB8123415.1 sodium:proton antiporter [Staphylococcus succinus]OIJ31009.1 sodium:proton antiporter [Staphylococcus sp. LCT-H4]PNZ23468.1 sodium:proton antiporter [Staphylococcus succinus subsp. succinus]
MLLLEAFLIFIIAVIISSIIHNKFPKIPMAFIQIALGVCVYILPIPIHFEFDSEVFMMAVIAPLLFVEGTHVSRTKLLEYRKPIILMAMALVFTTVIGVGYFIHWFWPELPMPAAFAIAAILCPTDAVAVQAITKGKILPKGSMNILEGESLLNDAAGIISFKIAVTALVTGTFSAFQAIEQFIISTIIGILIGAIFGFVIVRLRIYLSMHKGLKDSNTMIFIQLLTPFVVYLIAEVFHASGIIAVVVAGLMHGFERDRLIRAQTELQMNYNQIWSTLSYALNGFVFVVLGFIVPKVVAEIIKEEPQNIKFLIITTLLIALAIYVFRFIWIFILFKQFYYPNNIQSYLNDEQEVPPKRAHYAFIMTMCGIHGTISLSMALTLPTLLSQNQPFEFKNDLLFIASLMVLISLVSAQIILPLITPSERKITTSTMSYPVAKIYIIENVISHFKSLSKKEQTTDYNAVISEYFDEMFFLLQMTPENENSKEVKRLEDLANEIETETLEKLIAQNKIDRQTILNYRSALEASRQYQESTTLHKFNIVIKMLVLRLRAKRRSNITKFEQYKSNFQEVKKVMRIVHHNVTLRIKAEQTNDNVLEVSIVLNQYYNRLRSIRKNQNKRFPTSDSTTVDLKLEGLYLQRKHLDELIRNKQIDASIAAQIRENINYNEIIVTTE